MSKFWYYAEADDTRGPVTFDELIRTLSSAPNAKRTLVWCEGFTDWKTADSVREIVEHLFRPPPLRPRSSTVLVENELPAVPANTPPDLAIRQPDISARHQHERDKVEELPNAQNADTRGRTAFLIVLMIVVLTGAYFVNQVYANPSYGIAYLVGQLATPWIFLTAITWKLRHSTYTAAAVLAVAALVVVSLNFDKLQRSFDVQEIKVALRDIASPEKVDDALKQHPSNRFLQLITMANNAATETNTAIDKLSDEIEPLALSKGIELATAGRNEIESLRRDLKTAEANTMAFMARYVSLLKAEREKVEKFALSVDRGLAPSFLQGVDKRHATGTDFMSKVMLARLEFYRAYQNYVAVLLEDYGKYNAVNGKFSFPLQRTADRFNAAASAMDAAAKRMEELEAERKQLAQSQQQKWDEFVKGR